VSNIVERRKLEFKDLTDVVNDARMLASKGYVALGKWNLSQACNHINEWLRFPVDGYPPIPIYFRPIFWILKSTIMPKKLQQYIADKSFPAGKPTIKQTVFEPNFTSDEEAVRKLAATVERFRSFRGELHASPLFGKMDRQTHTNLQLVHAAHHLSFLIPKST
jgi:hypothetical protein